MVCVTRDHAGASVVSWPLRRAGDPRTLSRERVGITRRICPAYRRGFFLWGVSEKSREIRQKRARPDHPTLVVWTRKLREECPAAGITDLRRLTGRCSHVFCWL